MFDLNIADTRGKKFLKLIDISRRTIKDYGFQSFFRLAISELKKQKMEIFNPDISSIHQFGKTQNTLSEFDTYQLWLNNLERYSVNELREKTSKFTYHPHIDFVITLDQNSGQIEYFLESISSLIEHEYDKWNLFIYSKKSWVETKFENIRNYENNPHVKVIKSSDGTSLNELVASLHGDFVAFVNDESILTYDSLFQIIKFLNENQETDLLYTDEDQLREDGIRTLPFFKPGWSPYLFLSMDFMSKFFVVRRELLESISDLNEDFGNYTMYDLLLKITEKTNKVFHLPIPLYSFTPNLKETSLSKGLKVREDALKRRKISGHVEKGIFEDTFRIKFSMDKEPKVSIIIPTKDQKEILKRCIKSLEKKTKYKNFEIIVVDNNSKKEETISYLNSLPYKIIHYDSPFNFSSMNNLAVENSSGEFLLFLNDDVAALEPNWLNEMVETCQQKDVGAVGCKLVLAKNTIQHAGMVFLKTGSGFHPFQQMYTHQKGYHGFLNVMRDYSAVTGACLLTKKKIFEKIGGFDEDFDLYYGDSDLCLRIIKEGFRIVYTPFAVLLHEGSTKIKEYSQGFFAVENHYKFIQKWPSLRKGDPFYNPNLGWNYELDLKQK